MFGNKERDRAIEALRGEIGKLSKSLKVRETEAAEAQEMVVALAKRFGLEEIPEWSSLFDPFGGGYYGLGGSKGFRGWQEHVHAHTCTCGDKGCKPAKKAAK